MSSRGSPPPSAKGWLAAAAMILAATGCAAGHYRQASCAGGRQSIFILQAQAVPSATYIPCITPLPAGWRHGGSTVRTGFVRFWLDSDRAGPRAAEVTLTDSCDVSAATPVPISGPAGLRRYDEPSDRHPNYSVSYYRFAGGCVTYRLAVVRQIAPALYDEADHLLGFTPRSVYVDGVKADTGLTLCGAEAPPCPG
jgi:hypothetical protein